jgi:uncharacterized protein YqeY
VEGVAGQASFLEELGKRMKSGKMLRATSSGDGLAKGKTAGTSGQEYDPDRMTNIERKLAEQREGVLKTSNAGRNDLLRSIRKATPTVEEPVKSGHDSEEEIVNVSEVVQNLSEETKQRVSDYTTFDEKQRKEVWNAFRQWHNARSKRDYDDAFNNLQQGSRQSQPALSFTYFSMSSWTR